MKNRMLTTVGTIDLAEMELMTDTIELIIPVIAVSNSLKATIAEDIQTNEESLKYPDDLYLLGAYQTCAGKIWIITNATETVGMNVTTVLFPDER